MNQDTLNAWRQDFHRHPELALDLPRTRDRILEILEPLGCTLSCPLECAVAAYFDFGKDCTLLFRSDMDALPVAEQTGADYASQVPGCMHACGHDAHMTMLLSLAHFLDRQEELPWNVLLLFQPGEENPGGARLICETGLLQEKNVIAAFGMHVWPALPAGTVATCSGPMMAASSEVNVTFTGKSAHAAKYRMGQDALEAAAAFVCQIYEREAALDPELRRLLRFGRLESGTIRNVVADHAVAEGTVRAYDPVFFESLKDMICQEAGRAAQKTGCQAEVAFSDGYPAVINDDSLTGRILQMLPGLGQLEAPEMISEDFSFYQQEVPGTFFFLGTGTGIPLHDPRFDLDGSVLQAGADFWELLIRQLAQKEEWTSDKYGRMDQRLSRREGE